MQFISMAWSLVKQRDNFTFYLLEELNVDLVKNKLAESEQKIG